MRIEYEPTDKEASKLLLRREFLLLISEKSEHVIDDLFNRAFGIFQRLARHSYQSSVLLVDQGFQSLKDDEFLDFDFDFETAQEVLNVIRQHLRTQLIQCIEDWGAAHNLTAGWCHHHAYNTLLNFWNERRGKKPIGEWRPQDTALRIYRRESHVDHMRLVLEKGYEALSKEHEEWKKAQDAKKSVSEKVYVRPTPSSDLRMPPVSELKTTSGTTITQNSRPVLAKPEVHLPPISILKATGEMPVTQRTKIGFVKPEIPTNQITESQQSPQDKQQQKVEETQTQIEHKFALNTRIASGFALKLHIDCWRKEADILLQYADYHLRSQAQPKYLNHSFRGFFGLRTTNEPVRDPTDVEPPKPPYPLPSRINFYMGEFINSRKEYEAIVRSDFKAWFQFDLNYYLPEELKKKCAEALFEKFRKEFTSYCDEFEAWLKQRGWGKSEKQRERTSHLEMVVLYRCNGLEEEEIRSTFYPTIDLPAIKKAIRETERKLELLSLKKRGGNRPRRRNRQKKEPVTASKELLTSKKLVKSKIRKA